MTDLTTPTVELVSALLDSADIEVIGRGRWYDRAQSALEAAAAGSESTAQAVTTMARKLEIDGALSRESSETVTRLAVILDAHWGEWVEMVGKESHYLIALTRVARKARQTKEKSA